MRKTWVLRRLPSGPTIRAPCAEVDLGLVAGPALEAAEWELARRRQLADEATDAVVAAREVVLGDQILVDALGAEAQIALGWITSRQGSHSLWRPRRHAPR